MNVYPSADSWDEFYPSEIFIALAEGETGANYLSLLTKANIGATIVIGNETGASTTYKKVGDVEALADVNTALVTLARCAANG